MVAGKSGDWTQRQQLLASLDRQLRMSPEYERRGREQAETSRSLVLQPTAPTRPGHLEGPQDLAQGVYIGGGGGGAASPLAHYSQPVQVAPRVAEQPAVSQQPAYSTNNVSHSEQEPQLKQSAQVGADLLRNQPKPSRRVRRDDSDDRDDADDDGVWVDDDDDDDGSKQSSDVSETAQEPEEEAGGQSADGSSQPSAGPVQSQPAYGYTAGALVAGPHGYEVTPDDYGYAYNG